MEEIELAGFPLGLFSGDVSLDFQARALPRLPGEVLLVGSDGIHAVAGDVGDSFDADRLPRILTAMLGRCGREILENLLAEVRFDGREPLPDDVNLLAITRVDVEISAPTW